MGGGRPSSFAVARKPGESYGAWHGGYGKADRGVSRSTPRDEMGGMRSRRGRVEACNDSPFYHPISDLL
jgi:hypothetical protein